MKDIGMRLLAAGFVAALLGGCASHEIVFVDKDAAGAHAAAVTPQKAVEIAVGHAGFASVGDVSVKKCKLDLEDTGLVYEVEFTNWFREYEYEVDANTGRVVKMKKEFGW